MHNVTTCYSGAGVSDGFPGPLRRFGRTKLVVLNTLVLSSKEQSVKMRENEMLGRFLMNIHQIRLTCASITLGTTRQ